MNTLTKTIMIQMSPDESAAEVLERQAQESAFWLNKTFRLLYADKRNHHWDNYGADKDWGKSYGSILKWRPIKECWKVNGRALYPAFIRDDAPVKVPIDLGANSLQLLSMKLATIWGNFLNGDVPRPRGHLPNFRPVTTIFHVLSKDITFGSNGIVLSLSHPYNEREKVILQSVLSGDEKFITRLNLIKESIAKKSWSAIEIKHHSDGKWYAHIPITIDVPEPVKQPKKVMGIDVGVRNTIATSIVSNDTEIPLPERIPGLKIFHNLERVHARVRGLRSMADRGNKDAGKKLKSLKGKRTRIQETMARQSVAIVIKSAKQQGVEGIAIEDLRGMRKPGMSRRMNRLITNWSRGRNRDFMVFKSEENGLNSKEIFARGTSSKCPKCGKMDRTARDRKTHRYTCKSCGFSMNDDDIASINIAHRGWRYWNSPKWAQSRSTPVVGTTGEDNSRNGVGESFNPQSKQTDAVSPAISNDANGDTPEKRTNGTVASINGHPATSPWRNRSETVEHQKPLPQKGERLCGDTITRRLSKRPNKGHSQISTVPPGAGMPPQRCKNRATSRNKTDTMPTRGI